MRALLLALCCLVAAVAYAEETPDGFFRADDVSKCDGTTLEMSQCIASENEKAQQLLANIEDSFTDYILQLEKEEWASPEQVQKMREFLAQSSKDFAVYAESMSNLQYWNDADGTIRMISAPMQQHTLYVQQIKQMLSICTGMVPDQTEFDLSNTSWCISDAAEQ